MTKMYKYIKNEKYKTHKNAEQIKTKTQHMNETATM